MGWPEYGFAIFAFVLVAALVALNHMLKRSRQNTAELSKEKERRLFQLYQNLEELMNSAQEECESTLAQARKERQEFISLLQAARTREEVEGKTAPPLALAPVSAPVQEVPVSTRSRSRDPLIFAQRVRALSLEGLTAEKIAQELDASKGEVTLILGLQKR